MSAHKSIDRICAVIAALTLVLTVLFCSGQKLGIETTAHAIGYENRLFDRTEVHKLDIVIDDWDSFLETCESETYTPCTVIIDGEAVKNVGIRGKGNTSLSSVKNMDSSRYSFKIEFDQYDSTKSYHGLDKLCLNNIIQDNTYMKDYLAYSLMYDFGVDSPLCSYAYLTVNGTDWGLYLAVEAVEESFLKRNYGSNYGDLYKPDAMSFGGGRGNGKDFSMSEFMDQNSGDEKSGSSDNTMPQADRNNRNRPDFGNGEMPQSAQKNTDSPQFSKGNRPDFGGANAKGKIGGFGMGSSDVKLQYTDDNTESYSNIFSNAKTTVNQADKQRLIAALKSLSEQNALERTLDTDEVLRYFTVHNFLCNGDSYTGQMIHNYYLYEKDGQLSMIPWDYNLAFGSFTGGDGASSVNAAIDTPVSGDMSDRPMVAWIFDNADYTEQYHALLSTFLESADIEKMIDEADALIGSYVLKDPTKFCTYEEYQKGVAAIRTFCELRSKSVRGQLDGTIPATSDGQKADSAALIGTDDLNISDMGTMNGGGTFGGQPPQGFDPNNMPQDFDPNNMPQGFDPNNAPQGFDPNNAPQGFDPSNAPQDFDPSNAPQDFDPSNAPQDFDPNNAPQDFDPNNAPQDFDPSNAPQNGKPGRRTDGSDTESASETDANAAEQTENGQHSRSPMGGNGFPDMNGGRQTDRSADYILLGVSALALLFGLVFAYKFKR